jgi:hypothetical protein
MVANYYFGKVAACPAGCFFLVRGSEFDLVKKDRDGQHEITVARQSCHVVAAAVVIRLGGELGAGGPGDATSSS